MCIFRENYFSSHSGQTAPYPLFSSQPLNSKIAVERPIFRLGMPNFECSIYFCNEKIIFSDDRRKTANNNTVFGGKTVVGSNFFYFYLFINTIKDYM